MIMRKVFFTQVLVLLWATAFAQGATLAVTVDRWFGSGVPSGIGLNAVVPLWSLPGSDWGSLGVRVDSVLSFQETGRPSLGASVVWARSIGSSGLFLGSGVDMSWREVLGIPCRTVGWSVLGGVDVPISGGYALRLEGRYLPTVSRGGLMVGLSVPLD
jgi:hypothetical protein